MEIKLIGGELLLNINFEKSDSIFDDNICLCFQEPCAEETKLFRAKETNILITPQEARTLAAILMEVAEASDLASQDSVTPNDK
jgi:hypothetical protein